MSAGQHNSAFRWLKRVGIALAVMLLTLILLIAVLGFTPAGLQLSLWLGHKFVPNLVIEQQSGSLFSELQLSGISWHNNTTEVTIQQAELALNSSCLLQLKVCVSRLALTELAVDIEPAEPNSAQDIASAANAGNTENKDSTDSTDNTDNTDSPTNEAEKKPANKRFMLPLPVSVDDVIINGARITASGTEITWHRFSSAFQGWGNKLQLDQPTWQQVTLKLPETDNQSSSDFTHYQPPTLPEFTFPVSLFLNQLRINDFTLQQEQPQHITELGFTLQLQKKQAQLTELELVHPQVRLTGAAKLTTSGDYPVDATLDIQVTDTLLAGQHLQLTANGDLADLTINASATELITANANIWLNLLGEHLPLTATITTDRFVWPLEGEADLIIKDGQFSAKGDLTTLTFSSKLALDSRALPSVKLNVDGHTDGAQLVINALNMDTLGGTVTATAEVNLQQPIQWQSQIQLRKIQPGQYWSQYPGVLSGQINNSGKLLENGGWQLDISTLALTGKLRDYALALNGKLQASDKSGSGDYKLTTPGLTVKHAQNQISVKGSVNKQWQLTADIDIPQLQHSVADAKGQIKGSLTLRGDKQTPEIISDLTAENLQWQQARLGLLTLQGKATLDKQNQLATDITLQAENGRYQQQVLQSLVLHAKGSQTDHQLTVAARSPQHSAEFKVTGSLSADNVWQGQLSSASVSSIPGSWRLQDNVDIRYQLQPQDLVIQPHCWQQQQSSVCVDEPLHYNQQGATASVNVEDFDLSSLSSLLTAGSAVTGQVDAQIDVKWQPGNLPNASLQLTSDKGSWQQQVRGPLLVPWQDLRLTAQLSDNTLTTTFNTQLADDATLSVDGKLTELNTPDKQLQAQINLQQLDLAFLQPVLYQLGEFSGQASSNLRLEGNLLSPDIHGELALANVKVKGEQAPVDIDDGDVTVSFNGQQAALDGLVKTPRGELTLGGKASWQQQLSDWEATLTMQGERFSLQVPNATLRVSPDLTLTASPGLAKVTGEVRVPYALISIDSLPESAVGLSDDLRILNEEMEPIKKEDSTGFALQTDIKIILGDNVSLEAFGLVADLEGELRFQQRPKREQRTLHGDIFLVDGTFRAYGQDLLIRRGKISFNGPVKQPYVNIEAIRNPDRMENQDVVAGIRVIGPADEPNVSVFAEPGMPQANAMSYLLMGRDLDSESGSTGNAVTTGLIGLTIKSSTKLVGEIGEAFGLSDLTLDTAGAGEDSQVTVSGNLSKDLQLKYGYGIFNAVGQFTLRYRLMRNLYIEAASGLDQSVDLLYKFKIE